MKWSMWKKSTRSKVEVLPDVQEAAPPCPEKTTPPPTESMPIPLTGSGPKSSLSLKRALEKLFSTRYSTILWATSTETAIRFRASKELNRPAVDFVFSYNQTYGWWVVNVRIDMGNMNKTDLSFYFINYLQYILDREDSPTSQYGLDSTSPYRDMLDRPDLVLHKELTALCDSPPLLVPATPPTPPDSEPQVSLVVPPVAKPSLMDIRDMLKAASPEERSSFRKALFDTDVDPPPSPAKDAGDGSTDILIALEDIFRGRTCVIDDRSDKRVNVRLVALVDGSPGGKPAVKFTFVRRDGRWFLVDSYVVLDRNGVFSTQTCMNFFYYMRRRLNERGLNHPTEDINEDGNPYHKYASDPNRVLSMECCALECEQAQTAPEAPKPPESPKTPADIVIALQNIFSGRKCEIAEQTDRKVLIHLHSMIGPGDRDLPPVKFEFKLNDGDWQLFDIYVMLNRGTATTSMFFFCYMRQKLHERGLPHPIEKLSEDNPYRGYETNPNFVLLMECDARVTEHSKKTPEIPTDKLVAETPTAKAWTTDDIARNVSDLFSGRQTTAELRPKDNIIKVCIQSEKAPYLSPPCQFPIIDIYLEPSYAEHRSWWVRSVMFVHPDSNKYRWSSHHFRNLLQRRLDICQNYPEPHPLSIPGLNDPTPYSASKFMYETLDLAVLEELRSGKIMDDFLIKTDQTSTVAVSLPSKQPVQATILQNPLMDQIKEALQRVLGLKVDLSPPVGGRCHAVYTFPCVLPSTWTKWDTDNLELISIAVTTLSQKGWSIGRADIQPLNRPLSSSFLYLLEWVIGRELGYSDLYRPVGDYADHAFTENVRAALHKDVHRIAHAVKNGIIKV